MIDRHRLLLLILESLNDQIISQYQLDAIIDNIEQLYYDLRCCTEPKRQKDNGNITPFKYIPKLHGGDNSNCDMLQGPCSCGAWHSTKDWNFDSIIERIENNEYGHIY